ncbi:MAG: cytochrome c oxidase subunit 3 [Myxococcota bacterium]|nr:cytochrome c oxidase subunit 3 [Myxococcota bacterium]
MQQRHARIRVVAESSRQPVVPSGVLGVSIFVFTEAMLFAGLISAFSIARASAILWPPPGQPRLPLEETALNTAALLASGALLFLARRNLIRRPEHAKRLLLGSMLLGAFFVIFQGAEWVRLVSQGLTLTSSSLGSFFYLIVGIHGLHAVAGLAVLVYVWQRLQRGWLASGQLAAAEVFWYFVVGLWPILYLVVYL